MANVFLDLGTHFGQGLSNFINRYNMDESWVVHTFEANPTTYDIFIEQHNSRLWVTAHNKAVCAEDGTVTLHQETPPNEGATGQGSSIINLEYWNPWNGTLRKNFQSDIDVESISLSNFIKSNFNIEDNIIIKMDIEGAEFETLQDLIETKAIEYVNEIYVEWHPHFFTNKEEMGVLKNDILNKLKDYKVVMHEWH